LLPAPKGSAGLRLPIGSGLKVVSLTGREIHPVARRLGELTQSEVINGFQAVPPDEETLCVVINCGGRCAAGCIRKKASRRLT
jgi:PTS system glucitol/sorbitol-specific IIC component